MNQFDQPTPDSPENHERPAGNAAAFASGPALARRPSGYDPPSVQAERQRRSERLMLLVIRLLFFVVLVVVTVMTVASDTSPVGEAAFDFWTLLGLFISSCAIGVIVLIVDAMTPNKRLSSVVGIYLGILAGLMGALAVGALINIMAEAWSLNEGRAEMYVNLVKVIVGIILCYIAVSVVLTTKDDFRLVIPYVEFAKQVRGVQPMLLDSSALIDGRIDAYGQTGFLDASLVVPQFVINELQTLADSSDKMKRARGRRGLDMVGKLQSNPYLDVSIDETEVPGRAVDSMLVEFAEKEQMRILTTDYNLNKVAQIRGVPVLNLNDLANALRPQVMPGETMQVELVRKGESEGQGVGYMPDGTMVVVEDAADHIGESITLTVTNSLQTSAGKMIFGRLEQVLSDNGSPTAQHMARSATSQPRTTQRPPDQQQPTDKPDKDEQSHSTTRGKAGSKPSPSRRNPRR